MTLASVTSAFTNPLFASAVARAPPPPDDVSPNFATAAATSTSGVGTFPIASGCCTFSVTLTTTSISTFGSTATSAWGQTYITWRHHDTERAIVRRRTDASACMRRHQAFALGPVRETLPRV
jgi:hypothetical protein